MCHNLGMKKLLLKWFSLSVAIWVASQLLHDHLQISGDWLTFAGIAFIFGLINALVSPLVKVFTFPLTFFSLGLWLLAVNGLMLLLTDHFSAALTVENWGWAILATIVISLVSGAINRVLDGKDSKPRLFVRD